MCHLPPPAGLDFDDPTSDVDDALLGEILDKDGGGGAGEGGALYLGGVPAGRADALRWAEFQYSDAPAFLDFELFDLEVGQGRTNERERRQVEVTPRATTDGEARHSYLRIQCDKKMSERREGSRERRRETDERGGGGGGLVCATTRLPRPLLSSSSLPPLFLFSSSSLPPLFHLSSSSLPPHFLLFSSSRSSSLPPLFHLSSSSLPPLFLLSSKGVRRRPALQLVQLVARARRHGRGVPHAPGRGIRLGMACRIRTSSSLPSLTTKTEGTVGPPPPGRRALRRDSRRPKGSRSVTTKTRNRRATTSRPPSSSTR